MSALINFPSPQSRENDLRALQEALPAAVQSTVETVGVDGLIAFFDGYKESVDLLKQAA